MWTRRLEALRGRAVLAATLLSAAGASAAAFAYFGEPDATPQPPPVAALEPGPAVPEEPALTPSVMLPDEAPSSHLVHRARTRLRLPAAIGAGASARWIRAGNWYAARGLFKPALNAFRRAIAADLHSADAWYAIALCDDALHRDRAAAGAVSQALAVDAWHPMANLLAGFLSQEKGDSVAARKHYQRYLAKESVGPYAKEVTSVLQQLPAQ